MNVLYVEHYAGSQSMGMEFRPYYLAREWNKKGIKTLMLSGDFSHLRKVNPEVKKDMEIQNIEGVDFMFLKTHRYDGNGMQRLMSMFDFVGKGVRYADAIIRQFRPDVVICSSTYPLDTYIGQRIKKKTGAILIHEIHDLWPLSPIELGGYSRRHPFIMMLQMAENSAYRNSDYIVSILPNTEPYVRSLGFKTPVINIPNGLTPEMFDISGEPDEKIARDVKELKENGKFVIGYAGGISISNSMDDFIKAMSLLKNDDSVAAVIIGDGLLKSELIEMKEKEGLDNVHFFNAIKKDKILPTLSEMDALYIGSKKSRLYEYGVSANKIFDYLNVGLPIVNAFDTKHSPMNEVGNTIICEAENPESIKEGILKAKTINSSDREKIKDESRKFVRENHNIENLAKKFSDLFYRKR